jgi:phage/plasmid-associated DNA primase
LVLADVEDAEKAYKTNIKNFFKPGFYSNMKDEVVRICQDPYFSDTLHKRRHLVPIMNRSVLDLQSPTWDTMLRTRTKEDLFSVEMPFKLLPKDHPDVLKVEVFMREYCHNDDTYNYMHTLLGYCLTGEVSDRCFYWWWGLGRNAKGTVATAMQQIMGAGPNGFYKQAKEGFLTRNSFNNSSNASPGLASIRNARVVMVCETEKNVVYNVPRIKCLSSGDMTTARELYKSEQMFEPTAKILVQSNHLPESMDLGDQAVADRLKLVYWPTRYVHPTEKKAHELSPNEAFIDAAKQREFLDLKHAFGTWCVIGARKFYKLGADALSMRGEILKKAEADMEVMNSLVSFIRKCCKSANACVGKRELFDDFVVEYNKYCQKRHFNALDEKELRDKLCNVFSGKYKPYTDDNELYVGNCQFLSAVSKFNNSRFNN